jgi:hypothetical protein
MAIIMPFRRVIPSVFATTPGSASWNTPGTYSFTVPKHRTFSMDIYGAGGGGGGAGGYNGLALGTTSGSPGGDGGYSYLLANGILQVVGYGGGGGGATSYNGSGFPAGTPGAQGTAVNGDGNITGGGRAGGNPGYLDTGFAGGSQGGYGGAGGRAYRTIQRGVIPYGSIITIVVGAGGAAGVNGANQNGYIWVPAAGTYGGVYASWT